MKTLIKAARDLVGLTQAELCEKAAIPLITLRRIEGKPNHAGLVSQAAVEKVKAALEAEGILFLSDGEVSGGGAGVRLARASTSDTDETETIQYPEFKDGDGGPGSGG
ncbi:XRE family transcriptional regulator [Rhizobium sp. CNPSo 3968]|uniref:XRE family transcriptional regulator n=1 Tax=Rhizobium sp. CNPSo 3968 TaxID=3021408 RepID=UPI00254BAD99|nr:XRE family transcriptional regulator [Rhizobium sp. CNPSo 3968]MDK4720885.1 XRE family transcriptional regulator [Rhizobium sp. CNPSo 3968]